MKVYDESEIRLLAIQIGCMIRLGRLKKKYSQLDFSNIIDSNPTLIGRIERASHVAGWDKILLIAQQLDLDLNNLFTLKKKDEIISIIKESYKLEEKLNKNKEEYYSSLIEQIKLL